MEESRIIYETLIGNRCSDSHWSKVKKLSIDCRLPLDKDGLKVLINMRKVSPRYFSQYSKVKDDLTSIGRKILPTIKDGLTGEQFLALLKEQHISPNQSTISRWFKSIGGFKSSKVYSKSAILPVIATALIYKSRKQSNAIKFNT